MDLIPITNHLTTDMVVAGRLIPAGETRHFEASLVPLALRPRLDNTEAGEQSPPADADPLQTLLGETVKEIKTAFPNLMSAHLSALARLEELADKPRNTLLAAIQEELLHRASAGENGGGS